MELKVDNISKLGLVFLLCIYFMLSSSISFPAQDLLRWVSIVFLLFIVSLIILKFDIKIKLFPKYFLFIIIPMVISLFWTEREITMYSIQRTISFVLCILCFSLYFNTLDLKRLKDVFKLIAIVLNIFMTVNFIFLVINIDEIGNFKGIYDNKNFLANLSANALFFSIIFFEKNRWLSFILIGINSLLLIATGSRTAVIILMILWCYILFKLIYYNLFKKNIMTLFLIVLFIITVFFTVDFDRIPAFERLTNVSSENFDGSQGFSRSNIWEDAIPIILEKPILGWGYSAVGYYTFIDNNTIYPSWGIHNSYLLIFMELGFIGFTFFVIFLLNIFKSLKHVWKFKNTNRHFVYSIIGIFFVGIINFASESYIFSIGNPMSLIWWISILALDRLKEISR